MCSVTADEETSQGDLYDLDKEDSEEKTIDQEMLSAEEERQRLDRENMSVDILHQGKATCPFHVMY